MNNLESNGMSRLKLVVIFLLVFISEVLCALSACAADSELKNQSLASHTGIAMHGAPKYDDGYTHFGYANPDAPKGGTLRLGVTGTFDSTNPFIIRGQPALGLGVYLYETLMARSWDEPFSLYGLIAESVEVPDDRTSVTFNLRREAHWSDGIPITADDILFSFVTLRDQGRPNHRTYYKKVEKTEKLDNYRVKFTFTRNTDGSVDREMPLIMGLMPILPQHDWQNRNFNETSLRIPIGSGPYTISKLDPGRSITYQRDPHYWGNLVPAQQGLYNFDAIKIDYYRDDSIALQAFKAGAFDLRRESDPNRWITAYDHKENIKMERLPHHRPEPISGFIFNTRRSLFVDPVLRAALQYTFDFNWINRSLFHGQYHRTISFFPNSELAAPSLPEGKERDILESYRTLLPDSIFTAPVTPPVAENEAAFRDNLLNASAMLRKAGYVLHNDQLYTPTHTAVSFEVLLSDPTEEKVALEWVRALKRVGITATVHTVDGAQYQERLTEFNFDVTTGKWINTLSPGNEQIYFWGSAAADQKGSRNYPGIKDPVVDALARAIPAASTREDLVATTHALDRVLMSGHYIIPFYYLGADQIAYWSNRLQRPDAMPLYGTVQESWWAAAQNKDQK